jgi:eukaryotic-like serine/threonine-protein kinase
MTADPPPARSATRRMFGRYELRQVLGRSAATMTWRAIDSAAGTDVMLSMPRVQPADAMAQDDWLRDVQRAIRLKHPNLPPC